jgi:hypothetical protein
MTMTTRCSLFVRAKMCCLGEFTEPSDRVGDRIFDAGFAETFATQLT